MLDIEFFLIRSRLGVLASVVVLCLGLAYLSDTKLDRARDDNRLYENKIRVKKSATANLLNDTLLIERYHDDFKSLSSSGFLDKENRLSWIEQLERTANRLQLPNLRYQIDPQHQADSERFLAPENVDLLQSSLSFESSLLHEGDLVTLIEDLEGLSSGLLVIERCELSKAAKNFDVSGAHNFNANCDISLYTAIYQGSPTQQMDDEP